MPTSDTACFQAFLDVLSRKLDLAAVKVVNRMLGAVNLGKHSDQTFIGRIERGF
jgi:hypothetical protein